MGPIIVALLITWAFKHAWDHSRDDFKKSKAAHRKKQPAKQKRAAELVHHDIGYWTHQGTHGFPAFRHGFGKGWHEARQKAARARAERERARTEHLETAAGLEPEITDHRRRQAEARDRIREARQPEEGSGEGSPEVQPDAAPPKDQPAQQEQPAPQEQQAPQETPPQGDPAMAAAADTTYAEQLDIFTKIRDDAEQEVADVRRKRMMHHLDMLTAMGLDSQTLSEAAAIDDALKKQEEAAKEALEAAETARGGLVKRHGGIQEAVDSSPVEVPAEPEFYSS